MQEGRGQAGREVWFTRALPLEYLGCLELFVAEVAFFLFDAYNIERPTA